MVHVVKYGIIYLYKTQKARKKIQIEAARIVTGLPKYRNRVSLYFETGCDTVQNRRHNRNF